MWSEPQICRGKLSISEKGKVWVSECFLSGLTPPLFNFLQVEDRRGWAASESDPRFCQRVDSANVCTILPIPFTPSLFSPPLPHTPLLSPLTPPPPNPSPVSKMDLHRAAFKMESSSYLPNPLASPALMVLASTAEASRDASIPCQQPRPFGVPVSVEKDIHLPFNNGSYTFASMYHRQGAVPGFPNRDFPPSLLHLHHQFAPPNMDCSPISMLNHSGVGAFRPFASPPEDRDGAGGGYQSAFTPAKRLKGCLEADSSPHLRYSDAEGKEYDFGGAHIPSRSPSALKAVEDAGKKIFAVSGLLSDRETSSSPEDRIERCEYTLFFLNEVHYYCPLIVLLLHYIYIFSRRFYPKRLTVNSGYTFLSVCVPWELNPTFCAANAMLYHWATGTSVQITKIVKSPLLLDHKIDFFGCVVIRSTLTKMSLIHFVLFHILIILLSLFM